VRTLTQEQADQLGITGGKGVLVTDVKPRLVRNDIGVQRGYVILKVNGHPISSDEEFRKATSHSSKRADVVFLSGRAGPECR